KAHLGVVGELSVNAADAARFGVFAESGKTFPVYVRFSNGSSHRQSDKEADVRGFALKLVGVEGPKLISGLEHAQTQDFLFINDPALPFRNPEEFMAFVRAAQGGPALLVPKLLAAVGLRRGFSILKRALSSPKVESYAAHAFHTAAPIAFGSSAAKLGLFPSPSPPVPVATGEGALRADLLARLRQSSLSWSLRAQLFSDDVSTPIEDASVVWSGPWLELATLTLPKQDPESPRGREIGALVESLSFDPWHAIEAHRPLGAIMRARSVAYRHSVLGRQAAPEPTTVLSS
ncbi:MAG TPA: catalase, partial [Polyangiaceae bacterium]